MGLKKRAARAGGYCILLAGAAFVLLPFVWMLLTSLKPSREVLMMPVIMWENYVDTYRAAPFAVYFFNSAIVSLAITAGELVTTILAAYAFSRYQFRGRKLLMCIFLSNNMFPTVLLMIPLYSIMRQIGLLYTPGALVLSYTTFTIPFTIWLLQGFIRDFPFSLEEAALVDGCSRLTAFFHVFLPIMKQCLIAAGVYIFMQAWNEYTLSSMFTNPQTRTIPVALNSLIGQLGVEWDMLCAGGMVAILPVCVMFFFAQKRLVEGLTAGAVKG